MSSELEVEIKVPCGDPDMILERILEIGGEPGGEVFQDDLYLTHPCRDFGASDEALRIRRSGGEITLTFKGARVDAETKTREEIEVRVDPAIETVLMRLGFKEFHRVRKRRRIYLVEDVEVLLDDVEGLGDFVELEYRGGEQGAAKTRLFSVLERLGLEGSERRSYLELLLERGK